MCDYQIAAPMKGASIVANVREILEANPRHEALFVAPLGSMFDPREIPADATDEILRLCSSVQFKLFGTETRMEFLSRETMITFAKHFAGKNVRINIGLESTDRWVLANSIGKSLPIEELGATADLLHEFNTELAANILVGSPWLTPAEIIETTLASIRHAIACGVDLCVLFPTNVRRWTVQYWLWENSYFNPPSLWTLVEIIMCLEPEIVKKVALSYFDKKPNDSIIQCPSTCEQCQADVIAALWSFAATGQRDQLQAVINAGCACRQQWLRSLHQQCPLINERALPIMQRMAIELAGEEWWSLNRAETISCLNEAVPTFTVAN